MGSMANMNRCDRFIKEFRKDYKRIYGAAGALTVLEHDLGPGDDECVHFFFLVRDQEGRELHLQLEGTMFDPEDPNPEDGNPGIDHFGRRLAQQGLTSSK
jgi:hypothetical protein